jgi:hypothetical protein
MIVRDPEDALVAGALKRAEAQRKKFGTGRTVPLATHIKTHQGAVETVNRLAAEYADHKDVHIHVIDNTQGFGKAKLQSVEWLKSVAYNDIEGRVKKALEREHDEGRISHETYRGFAGASAAHDEGDPRTLPRSAGATGRSQPQPGRSPGGKLEPPGSRQEGRLGQDRLPDWAAPSGAVFVSGLARDAWAESDHPRDDNGQFGSGGSSKAKTAASIKPPSGPGLSAAGDEDGQRTPEPGEKFIVYRLGSEGDGLGNRNAGNAFSVAAHIASVQDFDKPGGKFGAGDYVTAYEVTAPEKFGAYGRFNGGKGDDGAENKEIGREASAGGSVLYSFPEHAKVQHREVGRVSLGDIMQSLQADHQLKNYDDAGSFMGGLHLRSLFGGGPVPTMAQQYRMLADIEDRKSKASPGGRSSAAYYRSKADALEKVGANDEATLRDSERGFGARLAQDEDHWITVNGGEGKGTPLLITGGGVVVGGAGGNLNGKVLDPKSKSAPRASEPTKASKSADIAKALQNRNRSSAASVAQMNRIAANPNPRLMMAAPTMSDGAPVVTDLEGKGIAKLTGHRDWVVTGKREIAVRYAVVEADQLAASNRADGTKNEDYAKNPDKLVAINNGRTAAMIEAYSRGTADAYKAAIAKAERVHGIPGKDIKAMKAPVLVRIMDAADVDEHIGDESNSTQTLSLSAVEQAQNDATRFDPAGIEYDDDGAPSDASVKGFINAMPAAERQSLSPNGKPTKQAIDRMLAATFHAAYGDSELVGLMAQATDPESRNLISGMSKAAGSMAKLKDAGELDIRELVTGAAKQIINAVRSGVSIKKFLKQGDLLTNSAEDQIAALFAENSRSAKAIGEKLTAAANFAYEESQKEGTDMFGDPIPQASREDALEKLHAQS